MTCERTGVDFEKVIIHLVYTGTTGIIHRCEAELSECGWLQVISVVSAV